MITYKKEIENEKYYWIDDFCNGGEQSEYFDTLKECTEDAWCHVDQMRYLEQELLSLYLKRENHVLIYEIDTGEEPFDEDEYYEGDSIDWIEINCESATVYRKSDGMWLSQKEFEERHERELYRLRHDFY